MERVADINVSSNVATPLINVLSNVATPLSCWYEIRDIKESWMHYQTCSKVKEHVERLKLIWCIWIFGQERWFNKVEILYVEEDVNPKLRAKTIFLELL